MPNLATSKITPWIEWIFTHAQNWVMEMDPWRVWICLDSIWGFRETSFVPGEWLFFFFFKLSIRPMELRLLVGINLSLKRSSLIFCSMCECSGWRNVVGVEKLKRPRQQSQCLGEGWTGLIHSELLARYGPFRGSRGTPPPSLYSPSFKKCSLY